MKLPECCLRLLHLRQGRPDAHHDALDQVHTVTVKRNLPTEGGFLLVPNHLSNVDPLTAVLSWYFMKLTPLVRFLAKKSMFSVPVFGWIIKGMGLIPVNRDSNPRPSWHPPARRESRRGQHLPRRNL